ncbi:MAG: creatininase family protein [Candidatus Thermoplasmatota archaeon]
MMRKSVLRWEELPSYKIKSLDRNLPIVVPIGGMEAHAHLPVGCDTIAAKELAELACKETGAVLAPAINYGVLAPDEKAGDIQVELGTFTEYIFQIVECFYGHGFKKIIIVNGHGGNTDGLEFVCSKVYKRHKDIKIRVYHWWLDDVADEWKSIIQEGLHADRGETDLMLALRPELVELAQARDYVPEKREAWYYIPGSVVDGHPTQATPEEGKLVLEVVLRNLIGLIERAKSE